MHELLDLVEARLAAVDLFPQLAHLPDHPDGVLLAALAFEHRDLRGRRVPLRAQAVDLADERPPLFIELDQATDEALPLPFPADAQPRDDRIGVLPDGAQVQHQRSSGGTSARSSQNGFRV